MIPGIEEINFPEYATLHEATITFSEMGEDIITSQIRIDGDITPDFSDNWTLRYRGEEFVLNTHTPQAAKDNTSHCSFIDATFTSFPVAELKRYFFVELAEVEAGTMIVDKYNASLRVNASNFIAALNKVLQYYFDGLFVVEVASGTTLDPEVKDVELNYAYLWEAVGKLNEVYGLLWKLSKRNNKYYITVGNTAEAIAHVFEYGHSGGLTRIERQLEDADIYNQLLGRGGTKNLPYRYFKKTDPYNEIWAADPDACAELENVYFDRLMDINFRYYVKGWLRNPNRTPSADYPVPSTPEPAEIQAHWAYQKGLTDEKFQPVEYVEDAESVAEYGVRQGKLEDNDDIYPTIQGVNIPDDNPDMGRVDEIVAVGPITDGDDSGATEETSMSDILQTITTDTGLPLASVDFYGPEFSISADRRGEVRYNLYMSDDTTGAVEPNFAYASTINTDYTKVEAERVSDGERFPVSSIPGGDTYRLKIHFAINKFPTAEQTTRSIGLKNVRLIASLPTAADDNPYCFRVWIKNIWQTAKGANENALEYMKRVWEPILGDRLGNEAKIVFSSGWMSASSDYEFTIVDWPVWDQSKTRNGVQSEWMLTLAKSDAEVESTGKYIPNATSPKPVAGDYFFFTGIDMPYWYVVWAEKRLNQTKVDALNTAAYANPTWAVQLDPVRIQTLEGNESVTLFNQLAVGKVMQIFDHRFSGGYTLGLGIRTMTVTWHAGAVMYPSVDIVLSEKVMSRSYVGRRILSMDEVNAQINSAVSGAASQMSATAPRSFLSKEHDDVAVGKLNMAAGATFGTISRYEDGAQPTGDEIPAAEIREDGHAEFDSMRLRKWLEVPELRYNRTEVQVGNQWRAPGGGIIASVTPDTDSQGNVLNTGTVNLKLEEGEIGKVAVDDICMGIFHDSINENSNAVADLDDSKGNFHFSGFYTTYFRITEVLGANNQCFRYSLRPVSARWTETFHPCAQMHFVCYGNFDGVNHADRQSSRYSTRTYERYLKNVNTWEFQPSNVAAQFGELSNLVELGLPGMTGYSTYIENIYMTGHIKQVELPLHIEADWTGQNMLTSGDSVDIAFNVMQGFDNLNQQVASWTMKRDSGNTTADTAWNRAYAGWDGNVATLSFTDLGDNGLSTLFMVTAVMDDEAHTEIEYGFTLMRTADITGLFKLDLNNENDTLLYNAEGTNLTGTVYTTPTLYAGDSVVSGTVTIAIAEKSAGVNTAGASYLVNASSAPHGKALAVGAILSGYTSAYVILSATYNGHTYYTKFNIKKVVGTSKYDLVISPDAIAYNATTGVKSASSINVKVFRTSANSSGSTTRSVLSSLPTGWNLRVDGSNVNYNSSSGYNISVPNDLSSKSSYEISLVDNSSTVVDAESVPVNKAEDGDNGTDGDGVRYAYYKAAESDSAPSAPSSAPTGTGTAYRTWYKSPPTMSIKGDRVYVSSATYDGDTKTWSSYSSPAIWATYAKDGNPGNPGDPGAEGDGIKYAYYKVASGGTPPSSGPSSMPASGWSTTPQTMTNEGESIYVSISTYTTVSGNTKSWSAYSTPALWAIYSRDGSAGSAGPAIVFRGDWSTLSSGTAFYATSVRADVVKYNSNYYKCIKDHTKPSSTSGTNAKYVPGYTNSEYWVGFGASFSSVATGLLFAENANVDDLSVYRVKLLDSNTISQGAVVGGMEAATGTSTENQKICLWLGSNSKSNSLANIPFYVTKDGKLKASNADITGKITASEGTIAGFTINTDALDNGDTLHLYATGIGNFGLWTNNRQNYFKATNVNYVPLSIQQTVESGKAAEISGGRVAIGSFLEFMGGATGNVFKRLTGNYTLPSLTANEQGRTMLLYSASSSNITISAPTNKYIYRGTSQTPSIVLKQNARYFAILHWDGSNWYAFQPDCIYGD